MLRARIEDTSLLGKKIQFTGDTAWSGVPQGRYVTGELGEIVSVYLDTEVSGPLYTIRLHDGLLIEALSHHFRLVHLDLKR